MQGITPVKSISYNSHAPVLSNTETSLTDPNGPSFEYPSDNKVLKVTISDGAGELTKRLFDERKWPLPWATVPPVPLTLPPAVTSYQCGDKGDHFSWLWPSDGIDAHDAL